VISLLPRALGGERERANGPKRINAHSPGACDHLLEDGRLSIEGISGTSAGAVRRRLAPGGQKARRRFDDFWKAASVGADLPPLQRGAQPPVLALAAGRWTDAGLAHRMVAHLSPYEVNA
jgi:NTE family protein